MLNKGKINYLFVCLFILSTVIFSAPEASAEYPDTTAPETEAAHEIRSDETMAQVEVGGSVEGVVVNVNPTSRILTVRDDEEDNKIYTITANKATSYEGITSLWDINPGDSITVDGYGPADSLIAETITLQDRAYQPEKPAKLEKVLVD